MSEHGSETAAPKADTHRIEGFSDGFFAVVITLLVLDLRPPDDPGVNAARSLLGLWPVMAAYLVSFVNIYILWVSHHELMRIATRPSTSFLYLNGGLLLGIGVMPFATAFLGDHLGSDDLRIASALYTGVFLWVALFFNLLWRYLDAQSERLLDTVTRHDRRRIGRTQLVTLLLYVGAFGLSWLAPIAGVGITLILAVFFAVADRLSGFASEDVANANPEE
jgi:uncharacterized membrane protein